MGASVGARTRVQVKPDTTIQSIVALSRKRLGFDQEFFSDSDFKVYNARDESSPLSLSDTLDKYDMIQPWSAEGSADGQVWIPALSAVGAGFAIGLAAIGSGLGQGIASG